MIQTLLRYPAVRSGHAPSVLVAGTTSPPRDMDAGFLARAEQEGLLDMKDLLEPPSQWVNVTSGGKLSVIPEADGTGRKGLRWEVHVDPNVDGGEGGKYPVGWSRIFRSFANNPLNMAEYDYLLFLIRVDSGRDEVSDDTTPVGITLHSNRFFETTRDLGGRQHVWIPLLFPLRSLMSRTGRGEAPWKAIDRVQFFLSEGNYADGTRIAFDLGAVKLLRFKAPVIRAVVAPRYVLLPKQGFPVGVDVMGRRSLKQGAYTLRAALIDRQGQVKATRSRDLAAGTDLVLDTSRLPAGVHTLRASLVTSSGKPCSRCQRTVECPAGPTR